MSLTKVEKPYGRSYNFSAGPATLPDEVLETARDEMMNYKGSGQSVMEMSHRSKVYIDIFTRAQKSLKELLKIPDNYDILFLQGGATMMFSGVLMNLIKVPGQTEKPVVDYVITGDWSKKAADEAKMFSDFCTVNIACDAKTAEGYVTIPDQSTWKLSPNAAYVHYTTNETIRGLTFNTLPEFPEGTTVVCDMSSDFLSRPIDVSKFGVIYAGAQKNAGPAGATIVIVRKDLLDRSLPFCPSAINFKKQAAKDSMLNTPPTYAVYICGLYFDYILKHGGLEAVQAQNEEKAKILYETVAQSDGYYEVLVKDPRFQSRMNVPLHCIAGGEPDKDKMTPHELKFVAEATKLGLVNLKGYRDLGGVRVSMYNAMTVDGLKMLREFMNQFKAQNPPIKKD
ncbi:Phosphoserine transaminase [Monocercomonoides exilis]|uniref:Phosphoserine transaminase n=1 Tax=Monocercomonoides exilis TaxID=2049356 RepID=UPI00355AA482|nr:Phosphoserine transaminase [Monocercomonoides exilis]|eukprot:MONOS_577.1-p1 / transcript=MONOS_577.1 / gene=MONOS_577 / organism=Monocercomonoides_exilis_PA203 / gene_product=Phosphoserine transaminase / transcript_product=Phosphoserine transaminase / location=Mono_scaffold00009:123538-124725(-) / protein_length=396 / sequence_SO=supercontig / SO=protein_coding / is_pseudo=false